MKISEITAISKRLQRDIEKHHRSDLYYEPKKKKQPDLKQMLNNKGWKLVGKGQFSQVYSQPGKNYIVKINTSEDEGFQTFVNFCKKYKSPYLPRILDDKFFTKNDYTYHIYLIEKLFPIKNNNIASFVDTAFYEFDHEGVKTVKELEHTFATGLNKRFFMDMIKKYPGLLQTIFDIWKTGENHLIDIHPGNVMKRKDGTPVIIDPFS